jgi:hypothetical protein
VVRVHPLPLALKGKLLSGSSSVGRASAFQAEGREFESRLPLELIALIAFLLSGGVVGCFAY